MSAAALLTQERLKQLLRYDPKTGEWIWKIRVSQSCRAGSKAGCILSGGYRQIMIDGVRYKSSRLAWLYIEGSFPKAEVDHRDTNRSNDRWKNLREATHLQNSGNTNKPNTNTSGFKGVSFRRDRNNWRAAITVRGKLIFLGLRSTPEEAHELYVKASKHYHGEFANSG